ncbi:MAG: phosphoesterase, partial [Actinomycetota bacterium]|nr:phosphoesterase [Actinomycetota bacterium]
MNGTTPACTPSKITSKGPNGDESGFPDRIGNYHKGLPHDGFGEVVPAAYDSLLAATTPPPPPPPPPSAFQAITLGLGRKLTNPQCGLATDREGPDPWDLEMRSPPSVASAEAAAEAVELYWMALFRDVPFESFSTDADVARAASELSGLEDFTGPKVGDDVTPQTIFRGCTPGDLTGPYLSQFLLRDIRYGSLTISQRQTTVVPGSDFLTD